MAEQYQPSGANAAEIIAGVETAVRDGTLPPGAPLPPVRRLAEDLGLAVATVAAAYRTLRQRGMIETAGRHGTHVRQRPPLTHRGPATLPPGVIGLNSGEPDPALLPDLTAALAAVPTRPSGYRDAGPCPQLAGLARERLGADGLPPGAVTFTSGALDAIERGLSVHLSVGDSVAVEDPCWGNLRDLIAALGMHAVPVPVDAEGPTVEGMRAALRKGARAVVVTSRAHNPTGAVVTAHRAAGLRQLLDAHPATFVIEDDHWAELADDPLHPVVGGTSHWLFVRSVSKPYGPDLRLAVATGDDATVARVEGRMRLGAGWVSTVLQHLVLGLWQDPATEDVVAQARDAYRTRRETLLRELRARGITATGHTGLNVWIPVPHETEVVTALRDRGYAVSPGAINRLRSAPGIRITISPLTDPGEIRALADAVAEAASAPRPGALRR
ncbi:aminotransferase class I/II-fold pyridoxal phosphate-dependent enzyme [Phytomonospora sp. NPDC050363]|uniref:aminotransferase class I/II-fold pyridoxal phosphate-dependent enzyme n=1 Tax=Phytomonospora sp. NPDC050363 TaxID=3155642 RepID=UPI0033D14AE9